MKKLLGIVTALALMGNVFGAIITIAPPGSGDLGDLDHWKAYLWRIDLNKYVNFEKEEIISARIEIKNIYNWAPEEGDILRINMVDPKKLVSPNYVTTYSDNQNPTNYFGIIRPQYYATSLIATWTDLDDNKTKDNLSFAVNVALMNSYLFNEKGPKGAIGFGFDPDCHYFNDGVRLVLETVSIEAVEPSLLSLLGLGVLPLLLGIRNKKK
ncbi:MAG: hypothetical protein N2053_03650 [Chitinispirillaceae bacterium]|nr:hypothetical protein [Chitinispirillaceae bacterium]